MLGIYSPEEVDEEQSKVKDVLAAPEENFTYESLQSEVFQLPANCPSCNTPCKMNTKVTSKNHN